MFYPNDDIFCYIYTIAEEKFDSFNINDEDELEAREEFCMYFDGSAKHWRMFLEDECFRELEDGNLKKAIVNTVLYNEDALTDIQTYIKNEKEAEAEAKARDKSSDEDEDSTE